jgi:uncharacterized membrane protein YfcA
MTLLAAAVIGLAVGFLGGLFGKGGSAVATPLLAAIGVPPIIAVAAPLPAAIPSTLAATSVYWRMNLIDWRVVRWSLGFGVPATVVGSIATRWVGGPALVTVTEIVLVVLGLRFLWTAGNGAHRAPVCTDDQAWALALVATVVGLVSGLLANSGGFLLAPLYVAFLRLPIKAAFASSLAVAAVLAIPGTIVHAALGHIDWALVAVFASTSVPLSFMGARVAVRTATGHLERVYGAALTVLGIVFLVAR